MPEKREDVEATLQQDTAPDTSQQKKKWRAIDWIAGGTFIAEVLWGSWWLVTQFFQWCTWNPHVSTEHFAQFYCGVGLGILSVGYLTLILWPIVFNIFKQGKDPKQDNDPRWFHARILSSGIVGGSYAFLLPAVISLPEGGVNSGGAAALRQAILLATGGLIALIALGETRRKNDNDREAAENLRDHQQDMLNQQKKQFRKQIKKQQQQFEANAFKERKAERRERYTKAVEQLGDEKAPIRMGGVYTLVGLVDEWLEEENLSEPERLKEGQVIINNLCAYIRSPFTLAARYDELSEDNPSSDGIYKDNQQKFYADKAEFKAEADVRHSIIKEIHDRLKGPGGKDPGAWSDFEYDFSGSIFFYPVDLTTSYYKEPVTFRDSTYQGRAYFGGSIYRERANFRNSIYQGQADFSGSTYQGWTSFRNSTYQKGVLFGGSTYQDSADFGGSTYQDSADFSQSTYKKQAIFNGSTYQSKAYFNDSIYQGKAIFNCSTYQGEAVFSGSIFYSDAFLGENHDNGSSSCFTKYTPTFYQENYYQKTLFGSTNNDFTVDNDKGYPIDLNPEGIPLKCKFLTSEQKAYLEGKFQEIEKINHIAIICSNYEKSKYFYTEILPFTVQAEHYRAERQSYKLDLCLNGEYILELFSFPTPPKRLSHPEACGGRHLALAVKDLEVSITYLGSQGVVCEPIRTDEYTGKRFTFLEDPDSFPIELYEI